MSEEQDRQKFIIYFQTFTTFDGTKYEEILSHVQEYALKYGLREDDMSLITKISFKHNLGLMRLRKLLKCLIPRQYCSKIAVGIILKQLAKNRTGPALIIKQFLYWLIGVIEYNLVETKDDINNYYHLFVFLLKYNKVDLPASKLVYLLTKPEDVTRYFTNRILELYKSRDECKHFSALLYLFKCYRPDVVPEKITVYSVHKAFGNLSNDILNNLLSAKFRIQKLHEVSPSINSIVWNKFDDEIDEVKSKEICLIPDKCVAAEDVKKLHKLCLTKETSCVLSLLNNAAGMYLINLGTHITHERLSYQLYFVLYDAFLDRNPNVSYAECDKILQKVASLQNILQQPIPVVSKFIGQFLMRWDGYEHKNNIYNILEWLHVKSFTELKQCVLVYLLHIFKTNPVKTKCRILMCLGNFTVNIIKTYITRVIKGISSKFLDIKEQLSYPEFIKELFLFVENLCINGILMEKSNPAILNTVIIIQENILKAGEKAEINFKISKHIPYTALFGRVPNALNATCRLINNFPECVSQTVKLDFIESLLNSNAFCDDRNKASIFNSFDKNKYQISGIEKQLHVEKHYAFICYTYLLHNETSQRDYQKVLNYMKKRYLDIFRFFKHNA